MSAPQQVLRFRVELRNVSPTVWRQFEIDAGSSFWDLHVAIQDAMGWMDYHLHAFRFGRRGAGEDVVIGIPDPDPFPGAAPVLSGREMPLWRHLRDVGDRCGYEYDFGDGWEHDLVLEAISPRQAKTKYPRCLDGARACPPEDCGGPPGYAELQEAMVDPKHYRRAELLEWLGGPFEAEAFDPAAVRFEDPEQRWREAFGEG